MARQVLPIVGAIVGGMIGGPMGASIGMSLGSLAGNAIDPEVIQGPRIGETPMQTSAEGITRPIVYATAAVMGNVIAQGDKVIREVEEEQGKGGPVVVTERLYQTFAIRICEGPIAAVTRMWEDEKLVYDIRPSSPIPQESAEYGQRFRLYLGTEAQMPDPDLEAKYGAGNTPAYRGTAYIVFPNADLTDRRGSFPNIRFEVASSAVPETSGTMVLIGDGGVIFSEDGIDFSNELTASESDLIMASSDRFVMWGIDSAQYTTDNGNTWTTSIGGLGGSGGTRGGTVFNDTFLISGSLHGLYSSTDGAVTFEHLAYPAFPRINTMAASETLVVGFNMLGGTKILYSSTPTAAWQEGDDHELSIGTTICSGYGDGVFKLGSSGPGSLPRVISTTSGVSKSIDSLPAFDTATTATAIAYGNGIWMLGTNSGECAYRDETGWHMSVDSLGTSVNEIAHNGDHFIIVGSGIIATSQDGDTLTTRKTSGDVYRSVACNPIATDVASGEPIPLSTFVSDIHQRCGHTSNQYDVSELTDLVDGIVLAGDYTGAASIQSMMPIYFFDGPEYDKKVRYHKRGKPVVASLVMDDLVDQPEEATRENAIEYPKKVNLAYQNPVVGYAPAKATTLRSSPDVRVVGERNVQVPVVMDTDKAAQISDKLMKVSWADADGEVIFTVSEQIIELVPSDCIGLTLRGNTRRLRIEKVNYQDGTLKLTTRNDRQSAYTSNVTGVPVPPPTPPPPSIAGATLFDYLDIPALIDAHDTTSPFYYVVVTGVNPAWHGAAVQRSLDEGASFTTVTVFERGATMGILLEGITDASEHYTDTTNVVRLQLYADKTLEALTEQQFLSEGGAFALEKPDGTWELMQYRDVEQGSGGDWEVSHLLRGRLNSGTTDHSAGARFVLLTGVRLVSAQSAWIGDDLTHRAVSMGTSPESAAEYTDEFNAVAHTEWPVANLILERDSENIIATAVPRHRFGTEDSPVRSINWSGYRWSATDGANTINSEGLTDSYTFDTTGWSTPITVTVSQLNRITGPGPTVSEEIS